MHLIWQIDEVVAASSQANEVITMNFIYTYCV